MRNNFPYSNTVGVERVVSASLADVALFLSASVPTASVALFPRGAPGPAGSNVNVNGTQGPPGGFGPTGASGLNALVLSGSRAKCGGRCYRVTNSSGSPTPVEWTAVDGTPSSGSLANNDTAYICSLTLPLAPPESVFSGAAGCANLVTTIAEAQTDAGICVL